MDCLRCGGPLVSGEGGDVASIKCYQKDKMLKCFKCARLYKGDTSVLKPYPPGRKEWDKGGRG